MPPLSELIRPVKTYSSQAQQAYLFLSESSLRVIYAMMYEPASVWKMVRLYDDAS